MIFGEQKMKGTNVELKYTALNLAGSVQWAFAEYASAWLMISHGKVGRS